MTKWIGHRTGNQKVRASIPSAGCVEVSGKLHFSNCFRSPSCNGYLVHGSKVGSVVAGCHRFPSQGGNGWLIVVHKDKDKDLFIGPQEFVVGYSKAPKQPQSSARPVCHSHAMTRTGREPATIRIAVEELAALRTAPWEMTYAQTLKLDHFIPLNWHVCGSEFPGNSTYGALYIPLV